MIWNGTNLIMATCCNNLLIGLESLGGLMTGLGLMSLALVDFEALIKSGSPQDRIEAGTSLNKINLLLSLQIETGRT